MHEKDQKVFGITLEMEEPIVKKNLKEAVSSKTFSTAPGSQLLSEKPDGWIIKLFA